MPTVLLIKTFAIVIASTLPSPGQSFDYDLIYPMRDALIETNGEVNARLAQNGCDTEHELACNALLQRSELVARQSHAHGDKVIYTWEIMVPTEFRYNASGGYLRAVRFTDTSGEGVLNFILDSSKGYTVGRNVCFGPGEFGTWHAIRLEVFWDSTRRQNLRDKTPGHLRVLCDGVEVLTRSGRPNIGAEEEVRFSVGLAGALRLAADDYVEARFRNVVVESWSP